MPDGPPALPGRVSSWGASQIARGNGSAPRVEVGWFLVRDLPEVEEFGLFWIKQAMAAAPTWFDPSTQL